jgi:hypothetical protein
MGRPELLPAISLALTAKQNLPVDGCCTRTQFLVSLSAAFRLEVN